MKVYKPTSPGRRGMAGHDFKELTKGKEPEKVGGARIAKRIHFEMPREDADVLVRYDDVEVNVEIPPDAWTQTAPSGIPAEEVTCR